MNRYYAICEHCDGVVYTQGYQWIWIGTPDVIYQRLQVEGIDVALLPRIVCGCSDQGRTICSAFVEQQNVLTK